MVVLDLTGATLDVVDPLSALAVAAADSPGTDLPPTTPGGQQEDAALDGKRWLLCLGGDNRCAPANLNLNPKKAGSRRTRRSTASAGCCAWAATTGARLPSIKLILNP